MGIEPAEPWVDVLRHTILGLVRRDGPDLTARQLCAFLTCYMEDEAQTIRGLASRLSIRKTAISRALDRLSEFDLVRRRHDPHDRRSVLIQRTETGTEVPAHHSTKYWQTLRTRRTERRFALRCWYARRTA